MAKKLNYQSLSEELMEKIRPTVAFPTTPEAIRRDGTHDHENLWRPAFVRDVEKIMHSPFYNRYTDKTQVFSFYKNDDISRRSFHVQLVSRIARNIGRILGLNLDLIEAIALGHDIGHTPFGHAGERFLNQLYHANTGRYFNHNVHSVRVLDQIFHLNISLQTLDGILCHNGEFECKKYAPSPLKDFEAFDQKVEQCYTDPEAINKLIPSTLEGCVVRICDMIAYIGKDRQDAIKTRIIQSLDEFEEDELGKYNATIINNLIVNIIENSYGKDYIMLDQEHYDALSKSKQANFRLIYQNPELSFKYNNIIAPMFEQLYTRLLQDVQEKKQSSVVYRHHIDFVNQYNRFYHTGGYEKNEPNQIVTDFIASMTDDYFIDLYDYFFPGQSKIQYTSYFSDL